MNRRAAVLLVLLVAALPALGLGCRPSVDVKPVRLTYWRVFDEPDTMADVIAAYQQTRPHVTVEYRKVRFEDYEQQFLEALAEDRGPDIFSIPAGWIGKYQPKIAPLPKTVTLPFRTLRGTLKKEVVNELRTVPTMTTATLRKTFVDVVANDVIRTVETPDRRREEQVLGLPLAVDTMVLFYNRDILNAAGIATVPSDWTAFLKAVARITQFDEQGQIVVAGAALGTAENVPRFADLLALLMTQNGATMADQNGAVAFHLPPPQAANSTFRPGLEALRFYADFASPTKEAYTWNHEMPDALEAFAAGQVAFFFGYSYHEPVIRARAPQLRWGVAAVPQADAARNRANVANYWVETVSKKSPHPDEAWDFIQFATQAEQAERYLGKTGKPTALRSLIQKQLDNPDLEPFASELLTAKSWYRGRDVGAMEQALGDLVAAALAGTEQLNAALGLAVQRINQTVP